MNFKSIFLFIILFLSIAFLTSQVDAINVQGFFSDNVNLKSIEVASNQEVSFTVDVFSLDVPLKVYVALYEADINGFIDVNKPIKIFYDNTYNQKLFHETYSVKLSNGVYKILINGKDNLKMEDSTQLALTVKGIKPIVDDISGYEEDDVNSGDINFRVDFHDEDGKVVDAKLYLLRKNPSIPLFFISTPIPCGIITWVGNEQHYGYVTCPFDSSNIEYDDNVKVEAVVIDNDGLKSKYYTEGPFIIDNREVSFNWDPVIISKPREAYWKDNVYYYDVRAVDLDDDDLTFSLVNAPFGMKIIKTFAETVDDFMTRIWHALIEWVPIEDQKGKIYEVKIKVEDDKGGYDEQEYDVSYGRPVGPSEGETKNIHEFSISNVIAKQDDRYLKVYTNLVNNGNKKENIQVTVEVMGNNIRGTDSLVLENKESVWSTIRLNKLYPGKYVIKVIAESKNYSDVKYSVVVV